LIIPVIQNEPLSISLPYIEELGEKMAAKEREAKVWQSKVIVDDTRQYFHRLLPETELIEAGFKSSNQVGCY
jgi:hypothetical protein